MCTCPPILWGLKEEFTSPGHGEAKHTQFVVDSSRYIINTTETTAGYFGFFQHSLHMAFSRKKHKLGNWQQVRNK